MKMFSGVDDVCQPVREHATAMMSTPSHTAKTIARGLWRRCDQRTTAPATGTPNSAVHVRNRNAVYNVSLPPDFPR